MHRLLPLLLMSLLSLPLVGQRTARAGTLTDVVVLRDGRQLEGTLLEYSYEERVLLVTESGDTKSFPWEEVKRVSFLVDKSASRKAENKREAEPAVMEQSSQFTRVPPERSFLHQVSANMGLGATTGRFGGNGTSVGGGIGYHAVRPLGPFRVGLGVDANLMSYRRAENVVAISALAEYPLGKRPRKVRPFLRLEAGPSLPFGNLNDNENITERKVSPFVHPSVGLEFPPPAGQWGSVLLDIGYRLLDSRFVITTETLDVIERNVAYRRLVLRGGLRF